MFWLTRVVGNGHQCSPFGEDCRAPCEGRRFGGWARSCMQDCEIVNRTARVAMMMGAIEERSKVMTG